MTSPAQTSSVADDAGRERFDRFAPTKSRVNRLASDVSYVEGTRCHVCLHVLRAWILQQVTAIADQRRCFPSSWFLNNFRQVAYRWDTARNRERFFPCRATKMATSAGIWNAHEQPSRAVRVSFYWRLRVQRTFLPFVFLFFFFNFSRTCWHASLDEFFSDGELIYSTVYMFKTCSTAVSHKQFQRICRQCYVERSFLFFCSFFIHTRARAYCRVDFHEFLSNGEFTCPAAMIETCSKTVSKKNVEVLIIVRRTNFPFFLHFSIRTRVFAVTRISMSGFIKRHSGSLCRDISNTRPTAVSYSLRLIIHNYVLNKFSFFFLFLFSDTSICIRGHACDKLNFGKICYRTASSFALPQRLKRVPKPFHVVRIGSWTVTCRAEFQINFSTCNHV